MPLNHSQTLNSSTPEQFDASLGELVAELQRENMHLQRLVSELLLKNQQLRSEERLRKATM